MKTKSLCLVSRFTFDLPVLTLYLVSAHTQCFPEAVTLPKKIDGPERQHRHGQTNSQVLAKDAPTPAFEVGFSQISFDVPPAQQFHFSPPPDSTVTESSPLDLAAGGPSKQQPSAQARPQMSSAPRIVGTGWTSVLVAELPSAGSSSTSTGQGTAGPESNGSDGTGSESTGPAASADLSSILDSLPEVSGTWGSGRLLRSTLFSVLLTDDGRLIAGAVAPEVLYKAASK